MKVERRNDLSLRMLEIFGTLMLTQTTVAAAEELGISQPSVSSTVKQLEEQLGFLLFDREKGRMTPTEEAKSLFQEVEPLFERVRSIEARVRDLRAGSVGKLRIMATPPLGNTVVADALAAFLKGRSGVTVQYDVRRLENVIDAVATGAAELGFCLGLASHPGVEVTVLRRDRMVALLHAAHPLAARPVLEPAALAEHGFVGLDRASHIGLLLQNAFEAVGVPYRPQVEVRYCNTARILAQAGAGIAMVDRYTANVQAHADLVQRPFQPGLSLSACLIARQDRPLSRLAREFFAVVEAALQR